MSSTDAPADDAAGPRARWRRWELRLIAVACALAVVHVVDERLVRTPEGVDRGTGLLPVVALVTGAALAVLAAHVVRPVVVAPLLGALGGVFVGDGGAHIAHLTGGEVDGLDVTGAPAGASGVVLLLLAAVGAFRRARNTNRTRWRWADRVVTLVVVVAVAAYLLVPVVIGTVQVHLPRRPVASPPTAEFLAVTLHAEDGPALQAWYRPSRNGAAVMVLNSARGDHRGSTDHARLLADAGYGVLIYDARGTGGSEGAPNGWGWTWLPDVEAGVDFLAGRREVVAGNIGLLGLSTGADVALEAAAVDARVRVVVADGATAQGLADLSSGWSSVVSAWPMYATAELLSGRGAAPPLADAIRAIGPRPVLLVAAGSIPQEIPFNRRYAAAGGDTVELWELPDVHHTSGLSSRPEEYADRVLGQLDEALLGSSGSSG
ncbi:MAG TPA: CocE/NonD family hydrolase [Nocardioides sp.]|nr:CocE/NonD family hydrolase [Nocardioides sp.]